MVDGSVPEATEQGKMWAALSYAGVFLGFPIGAIPLLQRDDAFALYHAKTATAVWLAGFAGFLVMSLVYTVLSIVTCGIGGILFPIVFLPFLWAWPVAIHGVVLSMNGQAEKPFASFGLGEMLFSQLQLNESAPAPPKPPSPPPPPPLPPPPPPPSA